jgi:hypothetical protein
MVGVEVVKRGQIEIESKTNEITKQKQKQLDRVIVKK